MASTTQRSSGGRKAAAAKQDITTVDPSADTTLDGVIDDWSENTAKEHIALEISTCTALLRGAQALREAQLEAARHTQKVYEEAAAQLKKAHGVSDLADVQLSLVRADFEGALKYWSRLGEVTTKSALEICTESASGLARLNTAAFNALLQWTRVQASMTQGEALEAEVDHVTSPLAASPMVWPAQEATRQAMTLAATTWNDWLSMAGQASGANGAGRLTH